MDTAWQVPLPDPARAVALAGELGVSPVLGQILLNRDLPDAEAARQGMLLGLSKAHIVKLSDDEGEFLTGSRDLERIRQTLWHDDLKLMVVTAGRTGCAYATADFSGAVAGFDVDAVDTTGAGDGFVAGLLQCILTQPDTLRDEAQLRELCRFANAVGALATTERGAIPALPTRERVRQFLAR